MSAKRRPWVGRVLFWGKWAGVALTMMIAGLTAYSLREPISAIIGSHILSLDRGQFQVIYRPDEPLIAPIGLYHGVPAYTGMSMRTLAGWGFDTSERVWCMELPPFWIAGIVGVPSAALWWFGRRKRRPGACSKCGYDLAGLPPSARCPECGTKT